LPADLGPILSLAKSHGLAVIEDAAQAIAAQYEGRFAGTMGTLGCFSFFPSKNLGCAGDGGMVTTDDPSLTDRLRLLRVHGSRKKYHHEVLGLNSRLDAIQAAILRVKLRRLEDWTIGRQSVAQRYINLFEKLGLEESVKLPSVRPPGCRHVYNQFTIRCHDRDNLSQFLKAAGISTEIYYPIPLHLQPAFSYLGCYPEQYPESERASMEVLSLPMYPELMPAQQDFIVRKISRFYNPSN
jgi:dTDP-4-amino-4,6-dideoxygalactose transaminase